VETILRPKELPFLQALCWQTEDLKHFTLDEMLNRYERGWDYRGVFGTPQNEEMVFIKELAKTHGSWISLEV